MSDPIALGLAVVAIILGSLGLALSVRAEVRERRRIADMSTLVGIQKKLGDFPKSSSGSEA